jgi:plasmid stabilization system protein ParE
MKIKILVSAAEDLLNGYQFYEKQSPGLGKYFMDTLFSEIDSLLDSAGVHPIHFEKYHRFLSKRFPFAIYYRVENKVILIYAILDCRRNPKWITEKLR